MGQYIAKDSMGVEHVIWSQEWGSSCGPACCYMVVCMVKRATQVGGEAFMRDLAVRHGSSFFDLSVGAGISGQRIQQILVDNGLAVDSRTILAGEYLSLIQAASELKPVIFLVQWLNGYAGGHWVVCVGANSSGAIILDPIYGLSEVPLSELPAYNPTARGQCVAPTIVSDPVLGDVTTRNQFSGFFVRVL